MVCLHIEDKGTCNFTLLSGNLDDGLDSLSGLRVHGGGPMKPTTSPVPSDKRVGHSSAARWLARAVCAGAVVIQPSFGLADRFRVKTLGLRMAPGATSPDWPREVAGQKSGSERRVAASMAKAPKFQTGSTISKTT